MILMKRESRCKKTANCGFTLLEVLVVMSIFSVIAMVSYTMLTQYLDTTERLEEKMRNLQRLQRTFTLLEKDLRYVVNRNSRNSTGETVPAIVVEYSAGLPGEIIRMTVSRAGFDPSGPGRLRRVAWQLDNGSVFRSSWDTLDQSEIREFPRINLLANIASFNIEQFSWSDDYGLQQYDPFDQEISVPAGVRITISTEEGVDYIRIFDIPNGT